MRRKRPRDKDTPLYLALACGATVEVAARSANLSPATVYRRLQDADFQRHLRRLRSEMVQRASATLTAAAGEAVKTLLSLQRENVPAATRLGAARAVLEMGMRLREIGELEERVAELEQHLGRGDKPAVV